MGWKIGHLKVKTIEHGFLSGHLESISDAMTANTFVGLWYEPFT